jgi:superkiller protein 3
VHHHRRLTLTAFAAILPATLFLAAGCSTAPENRPVGRSAAIDSYVQGVLAYNNGNKAKAETELKAAVHQHDNLIMAHSMLGDIYQDKRDYSDALTQYEVVVKLDPYSYKNYYNEGLMYQMLNRVKEAVDAYLRALQLNPQDALTNQNLGAAYLQLDDYDNAIKYCKRATELNDKLAGAWTNLAVAYEAKKMYPQAEAAYRKALEIDGTKIDVAVALAKNLKKQQKFSDARTVMEEVVRVADTAPNRKLLGDAMFLEKRYDEALGEYARALKLDTLYFPALNETGWVLITEYNQSLGLEENKRHAALDSWRRSLLINPNQPQIKQLMQTYAEKFSDESK